MRLAVISIVTSLLTSPLHATTIVMDAAGKTLALYPGVPQYLIASAKPGQPPKPDLSYIQVNNLGDRVDYKVLYAAADDPAPRVIIEAPKTLAEGVRDGKTMYFSFRSPAGRYVTYNLIEKPDLTPTGKERAQGITTAGKIKHLEDTAENARTADEEKKKSCEDRTKEVTKLQQQVANLEKEIEPYTKINKDASIAEIRRIQQELRTAQQQVRDAQANQESCTTALKELTKQRQDAEAAVATTTLRKFGVMMNNPGDRVVVYALQTDAANNASLQRLTDLPIVSENDRLYAIITNVPAENKNPLLLTVAVREGKDINPTPVRPSFDVGDASKGLEVISQAYVDIVLPFARKFRGNDIPQVTIQTRGTVVTEDTATTTNGTTTTTQKRETKLVNLLDNVDYPQVHAVYRYNFTTGAAFTSLRDPEFFKVLTAIDNPDSKPNEARYRIDTDQGNRRIKPILGITAYWIPIDPLRPVSWAERLTPNPTLAFDMSEPAQNVFLGFTNEIVRSTQFFWGIHYGKVTALRNRNDVSEDQDATAPVTHKVARGKPFIGVSFNLNFFAKIFKK